MKKYLKVGAFVLSLALTAWIIYLTDIFTGYPISYFVVKNASNKYIEENYQGTDFIADKPEHSIKLGGFTVYVSSPSSADSHFSLKFDNRGNLQFDSYESDVVLRGNTAMRLSNEYKKLSRAVFESSAFPFESTFSADFQDAISGESEARMCPGTYPCKWDIKELVLDKEYDISQLSGEYGSINLHVTSDSVSVKTAAQSLLEIKKIMEKANLPFKSVELWVLSKGKNEYERPKESIHILNFGWDDIYSENLEERIQDAIDETNKFYNK